ncbi:sensor histidine kinase [Murinocardiopsis flavida]|uniref:sensor histidine kinase n=1 Tax=Murinocardiopsis flavida TaxID=645275 RepID=UPI000D0D717D|nr:histidine kinase [Murinocardiopsis flavida]
MPQGIETKGAGIGESLPGATRWRHALRAGAEGVAGALVLAPPRAAPPAPPTAGPRPLLSGLCADIAAHSRFPVWLIRVVCALPFVPWAVYAVLWLARIGDRSAPAGIAGRVFLPAAITMWALIALGVFTSENDVHPVLAVAAVLVLFLPLALWTRAPLAALRAQLVALPLVQFGVPLLMGTAVIWQAGTAIAFGFATVLVYAVAAQYARPVANAAGICACGVALGCAAPAGAGTGVMALAVAGVVVALVYGDRVRRTRAPRDRSGATAAPLPAPDSGSDPGNAADPPLALLGGLADALWRLPTARPSGPFRLNEGPHRPRSGRVLGGVCQALTQGSPPATTVLRALIIGLCFIGLAGVGFYVLLWLLLPPEPEDPDAAEPAGAPVSRRESAAWFVLFTAAAVVVLFAAFQAEVLFAVPALPAVLAALLAGLPLGLLPTRPLLTWRLMLVGTVGVLVCSAALGTPAPPTVPGGISPGLLWPWPISVLLALAVVLYTVAVEYPGRVAAGAGAATIGGVLVPPVFVPGTPVMQVLWISIAAAGVLALGYNVQVRRRAQRALAQESALRRQDRARRAVLEERSRIARELHDVVSHHMSMIAIQAEAAPYKDPGLAPQSAHSFTAIRDAARDALSEMRRVVGLLREDGSAADRAPQPGIDGIDELVAGARQAGMTVEWRSPPPAAGVPDSVGLSAYRIVQESLSNAGRYAAGARVEVAVAVHADAVEVRVANGPPIAAAPAPDLESGGHGLVGMGERVSMLGGSLRTGALPDGGFEVAATLPTGPTPPS